MLPLDDAALVRGFCAGDEAAFEQLMTAHKEALYRFIFRHVHDREETEDILVRTFTKAWQSRSRYQPRALWTTWLYAIAINLCRDQARKRKRRPGDYAGDEWRTDANSPESRVSAPETGNPATLAAGHEESLLLRQAVDELPQDLKSALILCSLEGHSQESAAQILNCSVKAIETRIYRAKQHLRSRLKMLRENP
jgi:RNA polymerase sigma-70 factor (ECF subfamily)